MPYSLKEFESVFPSLVDDLSNHAKQYNLPTAALEWFQKVETEGPVARMLLADTILKVSQLQHPRWKMQPRSLCP